VIQRGRRDVLVPCVVQPRDVALVRDVRRYKFLTAPQLRACTALSRFVVATGSCIRLVEEVDA